MPSYFSAQISHTRRDGDNTRRVTETFVQDALSVAEACARLTDHLAPELVDLEIGPVKPLRLSDVLRAPAPENENARWFEARIEIDGPTADNPKARAAKQTMLVEAKDWPAAAQRLRDELGKWLAPVEVVSLRKSPVLDVLGAEKSQPAATTTDADE